MLCLCAAFSRDSCCSEHDTLLCPVTYPVLSSLELELPWPCTIQHVALCRSCCIPSSTSQPCQHASKATSCCMVHHQHAAGCNMADCFLLLACFGPSSVLFHAVHWLCLADCLLMLVRLRVCPQPAAMPALCCQHHALKATGSSICTSGCTCMHLLSRMRAPPPLH